MSPDYLGLRPHHALCLLLFSPLGHSKPYAGIMYELIEKIKGDMQQEIILHTNPDVICGYCPHNANSVCAKAREVDKSDSSILAYCSVNVGERISWEILRQKLIDTIIGAGNLQKACEGCQFLSRCHTVSCKGTFTI